MAWTVSATVDQATVAPGGTANVTLTLTSDSDATVLMDLEVYHRLGEQWSKLHQRLWESERFTANITRVITAAVPVPLVTKPGPCVIKFGLFLPGWAGMLYWSDGLAGFDVAGASLEVTIATTVDPAVARPGQSVTIASDITPTLSGTVLVDIEVYVGMGGGWTKAHQQVWDNQTVAAGVRQRFSTVWAVPADLLRSEAVVKVGVFGPGWQGIAAWLDGAAGIQVDGPSLQASGTIQLSVNHVGPGQALQIQASLTANLARPVWVVVRGADAKGESIFGSVHRLAELRVGQPWTVQLDWAGPSQDGQYSLGLDLYSPEGQLRYGRLDGLASLVVDHRLRHPTITVTGSQRFQETIWAALDRLQAANPAGYAALRGIQQGSGARVDSPGVVELPVWALYDEALLDRLLGGVI